MTQCFYLKLIAPRPTFAYDATDAEQAIMLEHARYLQERFEAGEVLLFGPVLAPEGAFGVAILCVADTAAARQIGADDPSVRAGLNTFEIYPMRVAAAQGTVTDREHRERATKALEESGAPDWN